MNYTPKYTDWLSKAGVLEKEIPYTLKRLITQFEICLKAWQSATTDEQLTYKPILEKTDAVIAAEIFKSTQTQQHPNEKQMKTGNARTTKERTTKERTTKEKESTQKETSEHSTTEHSTTEYTYKLSELLKQANELDF